MKCAIHQPQFLPWLGYLHKIKSADVFVFLGDVQFKKNEFQNRNKIRVGNEAKWITVPVSFKFGDTIEETKISGDRNWQKKMCSTIEYNYGKTQYFSKYETELVDLISKEWKNLAELNQATVEWLMKCFGINTKVLVSSRITGISPEPTQRLIDICRNTGADTYLSGSGGRDYLNLELFDKSGIKLEFQNFLHPEYPQCYNSPEYKFMPNLSAIDALFNCGGDFSIK